MINVVSLLKEKLSNESGAFISLSEGFQGGRISQEKLLKDGYLTNQDVYSIVSRTSRLISSLPIMVMNGENQVDSGDPFYDFFTDKWGKESGLLEGLNAAFVNLFLFGRCYILQKQESVGFVPDNQFVLPTNQVTPINTRNSYFEGAEKYQFNDGAKIYTYLPDELTIITLYDPSGYSINADGLSPFNAVWNTIVAENNRTTAEAKLLENRGIAGFVSPKAQVNGGMGLSEKVMKYVRESFDKLTGGASKFNKIVAIDDAVDFTQVGMSAVDMKIVEMRLPHLRDICNAIGAPSQLFNDWQAKTYANYNEAKKSMYTDVVIPYWELFNNQYQRKFVKNWNELSGQDYWLQVDKEAIEALSEKVKEKETPQVQQVNPDEPQTTEEQ